MNTDHHMERMSGHPAPRIEVVHRLTPVGLVDEDPPQRWHVRHIAGNGEPTTTSEQLVDAGACETNILSDAALFGWPDAYVQHTIVDVDRGEPMGQTGDGTHVWTVVLDPAGKTGRRIPVLLRIEAGAAS